jgi:single-strand DNA-binding protein
MNRVVLVGRITKDPELKNIPNSNTSVVSFTIAVNRQFTSKSGEKEADFINCEVFNKAAENLSRYIRKGGLLGVEGRIQTRNYQANDGSTRYVTEVICDNVQFLEPKNSAQGQGARSQETFDYNQLEQENPYGNREGRPNETPSKKEPFKAVENQFGITDDDLPF